MKLTAFVGWDSREREAYEVCRHTLQRQASCDVDIHRKRGAGALVGLALTVSPVHPQPSTTA
jgi:hypothetical protein